MSILLMIPGENKTIYRCERCDRETPNVVESMDEDNRLHHFCWDCVARDEKRFNQKPGWRRANRTRRYER
jgi:DNA-directed RNA polymerase subunit RPC12/RpoP